MEGTVKNIYGDTIEVYTRGDKVYLDMGNLDAELTPEMVDRLIELLKWAREEISHLDPLNEFRQPAELARLGSQVVISREAFEAARKALGIEV